MFGPTFRQGTLAAGLILAGAGILVAALNPSPVPATASTVTEADICAETIMAELDNLAEGENPENVPSPSWQEIVADCEAIGAGPAYSKNVGPALPLCTWEDGSDSVLPCFWNAKIQGNGEGTSYIVKIAPDSLPA